MSRRNRNMCVKIARDVLEQLRLKKYCAIQGNYVVVNTTNQRIDGFNKETYESDVDDNTSFKEFFKKKDVSCDVCALGSAFVSLVNLENKCSVDEMTNFPEDNILFDRLAEYFGNDNIALMESAFECTNMRNVDSDLADEVLDIAGMWGDQYDNDNECLRAIMLNVIRNKGDFKLPKKLLAKANCYS